jgi:GTPase SAR1 family protein
MNEPLNRVKNEQTIDCTCSLTSIDVVQSMATNCLPDIDETDTKHEQRILSNNNEMNSLRILLANGQPLLTNFEEIHLIELLVKSSTDDIERMINDKLTSILQMNYGTSISSLFRYNSVWILDFCLKHFQVFVEHDHWQKLFENILKTTIDKSNRILTFKQWQLQTLINNYRKQQTNSSKRKRRTTVRTAHVTP